MYGGQISYGNVSQGYAPSAPVYMKQSFSQGSYAQAENGQPNYGMVTEVDGLNPIGENEYSEGGVNFSTNNIVKPHPQKITSNEEIMEYIQETFSYLELEMPEFTLEICDRDTLKKRKKQLGGSWNEGIQGFCLSKDTMNHIFIRETDLASLMLVVGHELGHAMSLTLNAIDEEAKAYAFSIAWMEQVRVQNIAGLREYFISENPVHNGLHDIAFHSVLKVMDSGKKAIEVFNDLIEGRTKHINTFDSTVTHG